MLTNAFLHVFHCPKEVLIEVYLRDIVFPVLAGPGLGRHCFGSLRSELPVGPADKQLARTMRRKSLPTAGMRRLGRNSSLEVNLEPAIDLAPSIVAFLAVTAMD